jgi:hypothetical protein
LPQPLWQLLNHACVTIYLSLLRRPQGQRCREHIGNKSDQVRNLYATTLSSDPTDVRSSGTCSKNANTHRRVWCCGDWGFRYQVERERPSNHDAASIDSITPRVAAFETPIFMIVAGGSNVTSRAMTPFHLAHLAGSQDIMNHVQHNVQQVGTTESPISGLPKERLLEAWQMTGLGAVQLQKLLCRAENASALAKHGNPSHSQDAYAFTVLCESTCNSGQRSQTYETAISTTTTRFLFSLALY